MMGAFFALGVGVYFALPVEPHLWFVGLSAFISIVLWFLVRRDNMARLIFGYVQTQGWGGSGALIEF